MCFDDLLCAMVHFFGNGIVFGILGLRDDNPNQEDAAIAGIVVGVAGVILAIVVAVLLIKITNNSSMQHLEQTASFFAPYGRI
mgnify:CR=1 FL=1